MKTKIIINFFIFLFFTSSCKKDDLREYKLEGYAQKGPFLMGSNVTIIELDNNLIPTGKSYYSTIDDNAGHFEIPRVTLSSNYAQIKVEGSYYDENFGGIPWGEDLTLFSTVDISKYSAVNINLMSHIEEKRIKYLLDKDVSFQNAKTQAHNELLKVFNLEDKTISNAEHLNITSPDIDGGILLLISSIIAKNFGTIYTLQEFLLNILTDFKEDGTIDSESIQKAMATGAYALDVDQIKVNLTSRYNDMGISIEPFEFRSMLNQFLNKTKYHNLLSGLLPDSVDGAINILALPEPIIVDKNLSYCIAINSPVDVKIDGCYVVLTSDYSMNFSTSGIEWYSDGNVLTGGIYMDNSKNAVIPFVFWNSGQAFISIEIFPNTINYGLPITRHKTIIWQ